jgi:hypothetical protein
VRLDVLQVLAPVGLGDGLDDLVGIDLLGRLWK